MVIPREKNIGIQLQEKYHIQNLVQKVEDISIYPNPSSGWLNIELGGKHTGTITAHTIEGKLFKKISYEETEIVTLFLEDYNGMVLMKIENEGQEPNIKRVVILK